MKLAGLLVVGGGREATGLFTCPESLLFPVATSLVATIVRASRTLARTAIDPTSVALVAAFVVGTMIFAITVSDREARPSDARTWLTAIVSATFNCLLLCAAAVGVEKL
jgi:hypothetical protein